jgi:hypothetical protein
MSKLNIDDCLKNFKIIYITQIDLSYFLQIAPSVFKDTSIYANVKSDVQFINNIGTQLFNYFNQKETEEQGIWYQSLKNGVDKAIIDIINVRELIPVDSEHGADLIAVIDTFILDYNNIYTTIPTNI